MNCNIHNIILVLILVLFSSCANETTFIEQPPIIGDCQFELNENSKVGTCVGKINVDDNSYTDLAFFLVKTENSQAFSIDEKLGVIYLEDSLIADYELNSHIELELMTSYKTESNDYSVFSELTIIIIDQLEQGVFVLNSTSGNSYDGMVSSLNNSQNFKDNEFLTIETWTNNLEADIRRAFINFDLSILPSEASITEAILYLYNPNDGISEHEHSQLTGSNEIEIALASSPWEKETLTWDKQPIISSYNFIEIRATHYTNESIEVDVTGIIKYAYQNQSNYNGIAIKLQQENYYRRLCFASMNHINNELQPKLKIAYLK